MKIKYILYLAMTTFLAKFHTDIKASGVSPDAKLKILRLDKFVSTGYTEASNSRPIKTAKQIQI